MFFQTFFKFEYIFFNFFLFQIPSLKSMFLVYFPVFPLERNLEMKKSSFLGNNIKIQRIQGMKVNFFLPFASPGRKGSIWTYRVRTTRISRTEGRSRTTGTLYGPYTQAYTQSYIQSYICSKFKAYGIYFFLGLCWASLFIPFFKSIYFVFLVMFLISMSPSFIFKFCVLSLSLTHLLLNLVSLFYLSPFLQYYSPFLLLFFPL